MQGNKELFRLLSEIDTKKAYGTKLFNALARLMISPAMEAVCLRLNSDRNVEVCLTRRSPNDMAYAGAWHCPGSVMKPGEEFKDVFERLARKEFGCKILSTQFVANVNHQTEMRGHFLSLVYLCSLDQKAKGLKGVWFPIDQFPEKMIECHRHRIIPAAVGVFVAQNTAICQ